MRLPLLAGKISYVLGYPFIRIWLWRSQRVYVLLCVGDQILVTKNWLGLHRRWRLPGGGCHRSEQDIDALVREAREELGIRLAASGIQPLSARPIHSKKGYSYSLFIMQLPQKPPLNVNSAEIVETEWIRREQLCKTPITIELKSALQLLASHQTVL